MEIIVKNEYLIRLLQVTDAMTGAPVTDLAATWSALANWDGQSGGTVASGAMALQTQAGASPGSYFGVLDASGFTPSMNPVAIQVIGTNYKVAITIVEEVAWA